MSRHAQKIVLTDEVKENIRREAAARGTPQGRCQRLRIVLAAAEGKTNDQISLELNVCVPVVRKWRGRFAQLGLKGLADQPRPGKPRTYDEAFRQRVLATLEQPPGTIRYGCPPTPPRFGNSIMHPATARINSRPI